MLEETLTPLYKTCLDRRIMKQEEMFAIINRITCLNSIEDYMLRNIQGLEKQNINEIYKILTESIIKLFKICEDYEES